jgi:trans-aconitate methyltransferase
MRLSWQFHAVIGADATMLEILAYIAAELARGAPVIELDVLDPDRGRGQFAGEPVVIDGVRYLHRPLRTWVDLAERLGLRLAVPRPAAPPQVRLRFEPLDGAARVRGGAAGTEKYGTESDFARIHKLEDPGFVLDITDALDRIAPEPTWRVLGLGINTGDELALLRAVSPALRRAALVGVDHSASAIAAARTRFANAPNVMLVEADVTALGARALGRFDLVISIGTLQSAGLDDRELLRRIVQDYLTPRGALILGMPNCRYIDGEISYGARMKNFRQPELGLLVKDVAFYRKYLQQHHKQVFVTGKHYLLVTAVHATSDSRESR